ncbi:hypothetical protein Q031_02771 [Pseudomonas aeruginosa BWHPSA018]|nr:hypothetical protein Q031_02771 [Pseudomonas aeruginosa BWHPSA018]
MSLPPNLGPRNGILSLTIKDKSVLYAAYMPFIRNGCSAARNLARICAINDAP